MSLLELTEQLILSIVENKEAVGVKEFETDEPNTILIQVIIDNADMPRVIGKEGRIINSIRTIVQASSYLKENKLVKINVDCI